MKNASAAEKSGGDFSRKSVSQPPEKMEQ